MRGQEGRSTIGRPGDPKAERHTWGALTYSTFSKSENLARQEGVETNPPYGGRRSAQQ